jgi:hypothetical protein
MIIVFEPPLGAVVGVGVAKSAATIAVPATRKLVASRPRQNAGD